MRPKAVKLAATAFVANLFLVVGAFAFTGTVVNKGTAVSLGGSISFDGSTVDEATLVTYQGTVLFPTRPDLSGAFHGQGVAEFSIGTTPCSFTGVFGENENGVNLSLVGSMYATDGPFGTAFFTGTTATGCISATGAFQYTETDTLVAGLGAVKGATGHLTYTDTGFTLGPPVAKGAYGFFQWGKAKGTMTIKPGK
jgi:hypothetical protein